MNVANALGISMYWDQRECQFVLGQARPLQP